MYHHPLYVFGSWCCKTWPTCVRLCICLESQRAPHIWYVQVPVTMIPFEGALSHSGLLATSALVPKSIWNRYERHLTIFGMAIRNTIQVLQTLSVILLNLLMYIGWFYWAIHATCIERLHLWGALLRPNATLNRGSGSRYTGLQQGLPVFATTWCSCVMTQHVGRMVLIDCQQVEVKWRFNKGTSTVSSNLDSGGKTTRKRARWVVGWKKLEYGAGRECSIGYEQWEESGVKGRE